MAGVRLSTASRHGRLCSGSGSKARSRASSCRRGIHGSKTLYSVNRSSIRFGDPMAVRDALLTLLTMGPAYGFQLHGGVGARTGGRRQVNVGQTYATLE